MAERFLIDTNALIDVQMNNLPKSGLQFMAEIMDRDFTVSFVTYIEFLGYKEASELTEQFISLANVIEIDKDIIEKCILLRRALSIKLPDAIIAATAISHNLTLITRNIHDFKDIGNLKLLNPWDR
jgi:predicted nucleic acid-binding protein